MVAIRPFTGLRPTPELAPRIAAPPYDVLDSDEARVMAEGNPHSFLHVNKPEIDLDPHVNLYADEVYETGARNFAAFREKGWLIQDPGPRYYIYRQRMGDHSQTGVVATASVDDYEADRIKKHELTRKAKEDDRTRHTLSLRANAGPVFLTYRARPSLDALINGVCQSRPENDFTSADGVHHTLWVVDNPDAIAQITGHFAAMDCMYVADGHHRSASAQRARAILRDNNPRHTGEEAYNFFLAVMFPHDQLQILPYNRVIKDLNGMSAEQFLEKASECFEITPAGAPSPGAVHSFGLYLDGRWLRLTARPAIVNEADPVGRLDVSLLQDRLIGPILGITKPREDERINFVGGIRGTSELVRLVDSGAYRTAIAMYPTTVEQLMSIADAGQIMPPKSTWFEPKLKSGLVIHLLG